MGSPRLVDDAVWQQLGPYAGQLAPRTVRRVRLGAAVAVVLLALGTLVWHVGLVVPRVGWSGTRGWAYSVPPGGPIAYQVTIVNNGWRPIRVVGAGRSDNGLELTMVAATFPGEAATVEPAALPVTLRPGELWTFTLVYRIVDCAAVRADPWPVPIRIARPWGVHTAYVDLPTGPSGSPLEPYHYPGDPDTVQWQRHLAGVACGPP